MVVVSNKGSTRNFQKSHVSEKHNARKQDRKGISGMEVKTIWVCKVRLRELR